MRSELLSLETVALTRHECAKSIPGVLTDASVNG